MLSALFLCKISDSYYCGENLIPAMQLSERADVVAVSAVCDTLYDMLQFIIAHKDDVSQVAHSSNSYNGTVMIIYLVY